MRSAAQAALPRSSRDGITLFEIVLATIIFAGGLAVLGPQLEIARLAGLQATREADALNRAQSLIGQAVAMATATDVPVSEEIDAGGGWLESLTVEPFTATTLKLTANVKHTSDRDVVDAKVTLERIVFAPALLESSTELLP